jgi:hypothetical protein
MASAASLEGGAPRRLRGTKKAPVFAGAVVVVVVVFLWFGGLKIGRETLS